MRTIIQDVSTLHMLFQSIASTRLSPLPLPSLKSSSSEDFTALLVNLSDTPTDSIPFPAPSGWHCSGRIQMHPRDSTRVLCSLGSVHLEVRRIDLLFFVPRRSNPTYLPIPEASLSTWVSHLAFATVGSYHLACGSSAGVRDHIY
jgi:hypothetical protein